MEKLGVNGKRATSLRNELFLMIIAHGMRVICLLLYFCKHQMLVSRLVQFAIQTSDASGICRKRGPQACSRFKLLKSCVSRSFVESGSVNDPWPSAVTGLLTMMVDSSKLLPVQCCSGLSSSTHEMTHS